MYLLSDLVKRNWNSFKSDKSKRETCYSSELRTLACVSQSAVCPRIRADRGQTGAVQCCSAAVLQGHASDSPLYRYTAKPVPADAKNTREEKKFCCELCNLVIQS